MAGWPGVKRLGLSPDDIEIVVDGDLADDPVYALIIVTPIESLQVLGSFEIGARRIVVQGLHVGGDPSLPWGWSRLRQIARLLLEKMDVDDLIVHGAVRTTGANPGRRPSIVRLSRSSAPRIRDGRESS